jgi:hypothetical protein
MFFSITVVPFTDQAAAKFFVTPDHVDVLPHRIELFWAESVSDLEPFHGQDSYSTADLS